MQISDESLDEFIEIYRSEFGKDLSRQDAVEMTTRLVNLYKLVYRPLPSEAGGSSKPPSEDHRDLQIVSQAAG